MLAELNCMNYCLKNASVVNEGEIFEADIYIENGIIAQIARHHVPQVDGSAFTADVDVNADVNVDADADADADAVRIIDLKGKYLIPGIIDEHVHFREPGLTHKADISSESRAAVAGGVTSFMDMPNTVPQTTTKQILEEKFELASNKSLANFSFYIGATNQNLDELLSIDQGNVCGIKLFMGSSTGNMLVDKRDALEELFRSATCLIAAHCEDEAIIKRNTAQYREMLASGKVKADAAIHPAIRSSEACYKSTACAVDMAQKTGARLHVMHISTAAELSLFNNELSLNEKRITAETCPHYLILDNSRYADLGFKMKCNPAVKSATDRLALVEALGNGLIDTIGTDHAPHLIEEKLSGDYFSSKSGFPSIQHGFDMVNTIPGLKITDIVKLMCHNPATVYRIDRRGFIRKGYHADLAVVDMNCPGLISDDTEYARCGWSPYNGFKVNSKVTHTFVNGNLVYENGEFNCDYRGKRLTFNR